MGMNFQLISGCLLQSCLLSAKKTKFVSANIYVFIPIHFDFSFFFFFYPPVLVRYSNEQLPQFLSYNSGFLHHSRDNSLFVTNLWCQLAWPGSWYDLCVFLAVEGTTDTSQTFLAWLWLDVGYCTDTRSPQNGCQPCSALILSVACIPL